jgi:hypothetical protein
MIACAHCNGSDDVRGNALLPVGVVAAGRVWLHARC